jgi:hypothetical protein
LAGWHDLYNSDVKSQLPGYVNRPHPITIDRNQSNGHRKPVFFTKRLLSLAKVFAVAMCASSSSTARIGTA